MNASDFQRVVFTLTRTPYYVETPARHCKNTKLLLHRYITCHSGVGITLHNCEKIPTIVIYKMISCLLKHCL